MSEEESDWFKAIISLKYLCKVDWQLQVSPQWVCYDLAHGGKKGPQSLSSVF